MIYSFDQAAAVLDDLCETFPEPLFQRLNGGISLLPEAKPHPQFPEEGLYILGEYCRNRMGRYINLYYGSFAALARRENWSEEDWRKQLRTALAHELTHHVEGLAGEKGLEVKDAREMARWKAGTEGG